MSKRASLPTARTALTSSAYDMVGKPSTSAFSAAKSTLTEVTPAMEATRVSRLGRCQPCLPQVERLLFNRLYRDKEVATPSDFGRSLAGTPPPFPPTGNGSLRRAHRSQLQGSRAPS